MSNPTSLTWDNLDEWIAATPKDSNGHFLPNNHYEVDLFGKHSREQFKKINETLSTTRDSWTDKQVEEKPPIWDIITEVTEIFGEKTVQDLLSDDDIFLDNKRYFGNLLKAAELVKVFNTSTPIFGSCAKGGEEFTLYFDEDKTKEWVVKHPFSDPIHDVVQYGLRNVEFPVDSIGKMLSATLDACDRAEKRRDTITDTLFPTIEPGKGEMSPELREAGNAVLVVNEKINLEQAELDNDPLLRAQRGLQSLDVEAAEKEFAVQAKNMTMFKDMKDAVQSPMNFTNMSPEQLAAWNLENIDKAKGIVEFMDAHLLAGGRVNVEDKRLMNCSADLNQLIPFKYNWAWSLYLSSCAHHWMPAEMNLVTIKDQYDKAPSFIKKLVTRSWFTHLSNKRLFSEGILLNIYRNLTNPECRQYLLRQGMESVTIYHAWMEILESLDVPKTLIDGILPRKAIESDDLLFRKRHALTIHHIDFLHDFTTTTEAKEDLAAFVKSFVIVYTMTNFLMPLISHFQVIKALEFNETCAPLATMFHRLNLDLITQFEFGKLFVEGVVKENPEILTEEWTNDLVQVLEDLLELELHLIDNLAAGETSRNDVAYIGGYYIEEMVRQFNSSYVKQSISGEHHHGRAFVQFLNQAKPEIDFEAGLGGSISWD